ncbi:MAG: hypothetical protein KGZ37_09385 [Nitrosarchaeum sp.]|nr:hypothetical protein [Nitrosarchaeum sp.]
MSDDILDNVMLIITNMIIGSVFVILGLAFQLYFLCFLGGLLAGGIPITKLISSIIR